MRDVCDMDCFNCIYDDCINNSAPTKEEKELRERAFEDIKPFGKKNKGKRKGRI